MWGGDDLVISDLGLVVPPGPCSRPGPSCAAPADARPAPSFALPAPTLPATRPTLSPPTSTPHPPRPKPKTTANARKVLIASVDLGCSEEILTVLAMLSAQNIFYRPREKAAQVIDSGLDGRRVQGVVRSSCVARAPAGETPTEHEPR